MTAEASLLVGSAATLELSYAAEAASYWPLSKAKRVRRVMGLPVLYVGDPFAPRRARRTRVAGKDFRPQRVQLPEPRVRPAPAMFTVRTSG
jgi:hypothetical protein